MLVQPLLQWKDNKYYIVWVCICSLNYPAYNAHTPYCHLWPAGLYSTFPHYLINKLLNIKYVFCWVPLKLLSEMFLIRRRTERDMIKNIHWSSCKLPLIFVRCWWNLNFLDRFSKSNPNSNFMKCVQWEPSYSMRTDGRDKANSRFSQFCPRN